MNKTVLITGATGFVGTEVTQILLAEGWQVICAVRNVSEAKKKFPQATIVHADFNKDTDWQPRLKNVSAVINCIGIFYHPDKKRVWDIQYWAPLALFTAAKAAGVERIIHLSALGIEKFSTEYAKSRLAVEDALKSLDLSAVILRPSFIYGRGSRGGMGLIRSLSVLPLVIPLPGTGRQKFQPVYVGDLARAIVNLLDLPPQKSITLAAVSGRSVSLKEIMSSFRAWLDAKSACFIPVPLSLIRLGALFGNWIPFSSLNSDALSMLAVDNITSSAEARKFAHLAGIKPLDFEAGLQRLTAGEYEKWQAKLFFLKPLLRFSLAFMWIVSAFTSILPVNKELSLNLLEQAGIALNWQPAVLYFAAILNFLIGLALVLNFKTLWNCRIQLLLIFVYTLIITLKLPWLWLEPFGPVVKNLPVLVSIMLLTMLEKK